MAQPRPSAMTASVNTLSSKSSTPRKPASWQPGDVRHDEDSPLPRKASPRNKPERPKRKAPDSDHIEYHKKWRSPENACGRQGRHQDAAPRHLPAAAVRAAPRHRCTARRTRSTACPPRESHTLNRESTALAAPAALRIDISRKDSQGSKAALLAPSGRTIRLSSLGSQRSAHSALSALSYASRVSHPSVVPGASRSPLPHKMLLETSFCGPKPIETDPEI